MKIAVISGSPKGTASVTLRYVEFLQIHNPDCNFKIYHIGQQIIKLEKNNEYFEKVVGEIETADAILWATPVYYLVVPAQLKRFIEIIFERNKLAVFNGKPAAALTTSIHFFDHTAIRYLHAVSEDLGMSWHGSYTAEMNDLMRRRERARLLIFAANTLKSFEHNKASCNRIFPFAESIDLPYTPGKIQTNVTSMGKKTVIIADIDEPGTNLAAMVKHFNACSGETVQMINLAETGVVLGCRGCLVCGADNLCFFENRDSYCTIFEEKIKTADILIMAGQIKDRFLSARWKLFMDRSFYMNHVPYFKGKQIGIIISGPLRQNANLRDILESFVAMHQGNLVGIITDEAESSNQIDSYLEQLAANVAEMAAIDYSAPTSFPSVGGRKIFRDFIAGPAQVVFSADHRYYRQNRFFDYPQRKRVMQAVSFLLRNLLKIPRARLEFNKRIIDGMVQPFERVITIEKETAAASCGADKIYNCRSKKTGLHN